MRIIVLIQNFPGTGGRCVWLINRLPELGIAVEVVTNRHRHDQSEEIVLDQLSPEIQIHRTLSLNKSPFRILSRFFGCKRLANWLDRFLIFPDLYILTVPWLYLKSLQIARRKKVEAVMTVSPPESFHLAGKLLKEHLNIPWIANFEDLWTYKQHIFRPATRLHRNCAENLEQTIYHKCDHLIANTEGNAKLYIDTFGIPAPKISTITLGFDEAQQAPPPREPHPPMDRLVLGYMGSFSKAGFPWRELLVAIKEINRQTPDSPIQIRICGDVSDACRLTVEQMGLNNDVVFMGVLPHFQAVGEMQQVDALVVLMYETSYSWAIMPQKVYHYLAVRKPIIGIGEAHGEVNRVLRSTESGSVTPLSEIHHLKSQLNDLRNEKQDLGFLNHSPNEAEIDRYSIGSIARRLAECIFSVTHPHHGQATPKPLTQRSRQHDCKGPQETRPG